MTTNVYDNAGGLLTSDSRWSIQADFGIMYVDDTGFDKIEEAAGNAFLFAGDSQVIQQWKDFLRSAPLSAAGRPGITGIAILITDLTQGSLVYHYGQDIILPSYDNPLQSFAGSGAMYAAPCWQVNGCARLAVNSAKANDRFSGGEVKFFELATRENNLSNDIGVSELGNALLGKGMVMYNANSNTVPVQEAMKQDPRVAELCKKIANGQRSLSAPCDAMFNRPTQQDELRLNAALDRIFG